MQYNCDAVAERLQWLANIGRTMPPSWDGARISHLASGPNGQYFGRVLPGRGLYLAHDLKAFGITKPIPHVFERSPIWRETDAWRDAAQRATGLVVEADSPIARSVRLGVLLSVQQVAVMAVEQRMYETIRRRQANAPRNAITTYDGIITARAGGKGQDILIAKNGNATTVANTWSTLLREAGAPPGAITYTAIPTGSAPTRATAAAWSLGLSDPTGGDKKYLLTFGYMNSAACNAMLLIDLLVEAGTILATVNTAQTVNTTALTRYTSGAGVMMTFDITTQLSNTAHNMTVNKYTNQAGTANQTTGAITGLAQGIVKRLVPIGLGPFMQLAAGDYGVRSVEEYTNSVALAAGQFALNLYYPLAFCPGVSGNVYIERDSTTQIDGLTELVTTAGGALGCLGAYVFANTTSIDNPSNFFLRTCAG